MSRAFSPLGEEAVARKPCLRPRIRSKRKPWPMPTAAFLQKEVLHALPDDESLLAKADQVCFSLSKKRRWELAQRLSDPECSPPLDLPPRDGLDLFVSVRHHEPYTHVEANSWWNTHNQWAEQILVRSDIGGASEEVVERRGKATFTHFASLNQPERRPRRLRRARDRLGREPSPSPTPLINDKENGRLKVAFHIYRPSTAQGFVAAKAEKMARSSRSERDLSSRSTQRRKELRHRHYDIEEELHSFTSQDLDGDWDEAEHATLSKPEPLSFGDFSPPLRPSPKKPKKERKLETGLIPTSQWFYSCNTETQVHGRLSESNSDLDSGAGSSADDNSAFELISIPPLPPSVTFPPIRLIMADSELDSFTLEERYGEAFWESRLSPRRFLVDISQSLRNVHRLAHGAEAESRDVVAYVVFTVAPPSRSSFKLSEMLGDEAETWSFVDVWLNAKVNAKAESVRLDLSSLSETGDASMDEVLKCAALRLGTLPYSIFDLAPASTVARREAAVVCGVGEIEPGVSKTRSFPSEAANSVLLDAAKRRAANASTKLGAEDSGMESDEEILTAESWMWNSHWSSSPSSAECGVCFEVSSEAASLLSCGHRFCLECWEGGAREVLSEGRARIPCMEPGCEEELDWASAASLLPVALLRRFETLMAEAELLRHRPDWTYCPNPTCSRLHLASASSHFHGGKTSVCLCGHRWCRLCEETPHWPVDCLMAASYRRLLVASGDDKLASPDNERKVRVKRCPHCSTLMEKGAGCNYMACRCGQGFCWGCGGKWESGRHYNCTEKPQGGQGFTTVALVDVPKASIPSPHGLLPKRAYYAAVAHRQRRLEIEKMGRAAKKLTAGAVVATGKGSRAFQARLLRLSSAGHSALEWWELWRFAQPRRMGGGCPLPSSAAAAALSFQLTRLDDALCSSSFDFASVQSLHGLSNRIAHSLRSLSLLTPLPN